MTHLDLFSGIGGFTIAAQNSGFTTIGFSEIDPYACKILKRHWPHIPNHGDIRNVRNIRADLVTGGFPCQPFSCAGKRRGTADDRHLWPEMLRVIDEARPTWVLGENVPGIIGMELDHVLSDLENIGYACWPVVVPACAVDARHRRDRVWIMAYAAGGRGQWRGPAPRETQKSSDLSSGPSETMAYSEGNGRNQRGAECAGQLGLAASNGAGGDVAHANQSGPQGRNGEELSECGTERIAGQGCSPASNTAGINAGAGRPERPKAWEETGCRWKPEPAVGRVAHGIPNRSHRLKGLGNAIVPQVAEIFLRGMGWRVKKKP